MSYDNVMTAEEFASLVKRDPKQILRYMMEIAQASREFPDKALIIPFTSIPKDAPGNIYLRDFGRLFSGSTGLCRKAKLPEIEEVLNNLDGWFNIKGFTFEGYVLAGSAAVLACQVGDNKPSDGDFYPYYDSKNLIHNSVQETILVSYRKFLEDVEDSNEDHEEIRTMRNKNCTTLLVGERRPLQMIHRAHTSARSTVVGFDQMACKAFFDGEMVYFTIDAALCLYFGINPVDWRRESPSHMSRVTKYDEYHFVPIFPHLSFGFVDRRTPKSLPYKLPSAALRVDRTGYKNEQRLNVAIVLDRYVSESDYNEDTEIEKIGNLGLWYHATCMLIKGKYDLFPVFSDKPTYTLSNGYFVPLNCVLEKVAAGNKCDFYFGDERTWDISNEISNILVKVTDRGRNVKISAVSTEKLNRIIELQTEYRKIIDDRVAQLESSIPDTCVSRLTKIEFNISNPGAQFTSSFKPIRRETPQDYWGPECVYFECNTFHKIKFTLLCIRHRLKIEKSSYFGFFGKDLMLLLFSYIYVAHFRHEATINDNFLPIERIDIKQRFPWHDTTSDDEDLIQELIKNVTDSIKNSKK